MAGERDGLLRSISNRQLLLSAHDGSLEEVKKMVEEDKTDVTFTDSDGNTVLHWACKGGAKYVVEFLVRLPSVDLFKENTKMETALDVLYKNNPALITEGMKRALLQHGYETIEAYTPKHSIEMGVSPFKRNFLDETCADRFDCPYSLDDVRTALAFLSSPVSADKISEIAFAAKFALPVVIGVDQRSITLYFYCTQEKQTFFELEKSTLRNEAIELISAKLGLNDMVTEALFKVRTIIEELQFPNLYRKCPVKQIMESVLTAPWNDSIKTERVFLAAIINEMRTTNEKISLYYEFLDNVKNNHADSVAKSAVCVIYFLELFSCDDTFPEGKNIKLVKDEVRLLKKLKKEYYKRHYPDSGLLKDIADLRTLLVHELSSSRGLLQPRDLFERSDEDAVCYSKEYCLEYLHTFTKYVRSSMCNESRCQGIQEENKNFFKNFSNNLRGHLEKSQKTSDMLDNFCMKTQEFLQNAHGEVLYDLLFELIVNVGHQLGEYPMFKGIRNSSVHGFHDETISGLKSKLPLLFRKLYVYQLAEKLGNVLLTMRDEKENNNLTNTLSEKLEEINKTFEKLPTTGELSHGVEQWDDDSLDTNIKIYVMCLSDLLDDASTDGDNILELDAKRLVCSDQIQIKSIFEDLLNLHHSCLRKQRVPYLKERLQRALAKQFGLQTSEADEVIDRIENTDLFETDVNLEFCKELVGIISSLRNLKHPHSVSGHTFVDDELISLFHARKTGKSSHEFENVLANYNLTERDKDTVTDVLNKIFSQMLETEVLFSGKRVVLNVTSVVSHLLGLIKNMEPFQYKLENLSKVFRDPMLLDFLSRKILIEPKCPQEFVKFRLYKVIRDIHSLDDAAPLVAKVLTDNETNKTVVERRTVEQIIGVFLKTEDTMSLENLLGASNILRKNSFEVIIEQECSRELLAKVLKCIPPENEGSCFENVKSCFDLLTSSDITKVHRVLAAANDVIFDYLSDKKFKYCLNVIDCAEELEIRVKETVDTDKTLAIQRNLLKASCLLDLGLRFEKDKEDRCKIKDFYNKSQEVLEGVWKNCLKDGVLERCDKGQLTPMNEATLEHPAQGMLSLSKLAYNHYLLGKNETYANKKKKHYKKARYYAGKLIEVMLQYVGRSSPACNHQDHSNRAVASADYTLPYNIGELFKLIESSPKYQRLLELGEHYEINLNISRICRDFLYYRLRSLDKQSKSEDRVKLMEEYNTLKKLSPSFLKIYFLKRKIDIIERSCLECGEFQKLETKTRSERNELELLQRSLERNESKCSKLKKILKNNERIAYDELKGLELHITCLKLAIQRYGTYSPTAEERFNFLKSKLKIFQGC